MEVKDYSHEFETKPSVGHHSAIFPETIRCVIAGTSGCGKTMLLTNFLREPGLLDYEDFYIYCPTIHQDTYTNLKKHFDEQEMILQVEYKKRTNKPKYNKIAHFIIPIDSKKSTKNSKEDQDEILKEAIKYPKELDSKCNHIMVFDDVMLKDQYIIKEYFTTGRHNNVNIFYLAQSFYKIEKDCIRDNMNMLILFRQGKKTLRCIYDDIVSGDMDDINEFFEICYNAWKKPHDFIVIIIDGDPKYGKYWDNYKHVYTPKAYLDEI